MDTLVFDIETKNFFSDPGVGWNNFAALEISVVGIYSYSENKYLCFDENETEKLAEYFRQANRIIGFSMNRYDVPVLDLKFKSFKETKDIDLWGKERVDLLEEIEMVTGRRVSLSKLSEANLGVAKAHSGAEAIDFYKEGRMEELKAYCLEDVRLTKELYDLFRKQRYFLLPNKFTGENDKVEFAEDNQARLF